MKTIVVVGSSNTDMVIKAPRLPRPGETVTRGAFFRARGGKGANQAVAAARAGGRVALIASVGLDALGRESIEAFADEGIDTTHVMQTAAAPSGVALILVDADAQNSIAVAEGANALLSASDVRKCEPAIASAAVLVVQLEIPLDAVTEAVAMAHAHRVRIVLNPAPACPLPDDLLAHVSVLTPNDSETEFLTGISPASDAAMDRAASALLARGVEAVVMTLGSSGVFVAAGNQRERISAWPVTPEDTTGAGDVFTGTLAVALAEGKPLIDAARFANAADALSVTRRGAQPSAPRRQEIIDLIEGHSSLTVAPGSSDPGERESA
jgi:ribokinase